MKQKMPIEYHVIKSGRKTVLITINEHAEVIVRAPWRVSEGQLRAIVEEKQDWILKKRQEIQDRNEKRQPRTYGSGLQCPLYGRAYELDILENANLNICKIHTEGARLILEGPVKEEEQVRELLREWYIRQAREIFAQQAAYYAASMGVSYGTIRIREQKTRWGSCSSKGNLNFNWKLLLAPPRVLDYVVVHELSHLKHMDHSPNFWNCVREVLPEFEEQRRWLREHGRELEW